LSLYSGIIKEAEKANDLEFVEIVKVKMEECDKKTNFNDKTLIGIWGNENKVLRYIPKLTALVSKENVEIVLGGMEDKEVFKWLFREKLVFWLDNRNGFEDCLRVAKGREVVDIAKDIPDLSVVPWIPPYRVVIYNQIRSFLKGYKDVVLFQSKEGDSYRLKGGKTYIRLGDESDAFMRMSYIDWRSKTKEWQIYAIGICKGIDADEDSWLKYISESMGFGKKSLELLGLKS